MIANKFSSLFVSRNFQLHSKTHEGEKCYKCDICPYASISARHLESHMLIHTDQKPFLCDQCDQSFRQKQLLKRHQNLYHNPSYVPPPPREKTHECPECSRAFRHKGNLIRHMAIHDPDLSIQEKQLALKLGRQKKIQMIDGQQVEVMPQLESEEDEDEDEDEEDDGDMMAVEGSDGQQYVVLEVIQLADGEEQAMVVSDGNSELLSESILPDNGKWIIILFLMYFNFISFLYQVLINTETKLLKIGKYFFLING